MHANVRAVPAVQAFVAVWRGGTTVVMPPLSVVSAFQAIESDRVLRVDPVGLTFELVQRVHISLGRRHDDVGIGADTVHDAPCLGQSHRYLALLPGALR